MKIRQGFVSNSSSASFTMKWKINAPDIYSKDQAIDDIMQYGRDDIIEEIKKHTIEAGNNEFITTDWIVMMNSLDDFPDWIHAFHFAVSLGAAEIISVKIEDES